MIDPREPAKVLADELRRNAMALEKGSFDDIRVALLKTMATVAVLVEQQAATLYQLNETTKLLRRMTKRR